MGGHLFKESDGSHLPDERDIETILKIDAEIAKQEFDAAMVAFGRVSAAPPNGGKTKDIENAVARRYVARENFILALHRLNQFISERKAPEYLWLSGSGL